MNFLTVNSLSDRLQHKLHYETLEQHKFARLAMSSYYYNDQMYVTNNLFQAMIELDEFVLDRELSSEEHSIFHNQKTGETVITYRGTTNLDDVKTDSNIALGNEKNTKRYERSEEVFLKTKEKYGNDNIVVTGHSLGANQSLNICEKYNVKLLM